MLKFKKNKEKKTGAEGQQAGAAAGARNPQGISAKGNALFDVGRIALLAVLIPIIAGFAYLLMLREPAVESAQIQHIAQSYAAQQASGIEKLLVGLNSRVQSAAKSPLALAAIASQSERDVALVEKAILDYFPEVSSLRLIPIGELGTADFSENNNGLRNLIEVDMVRRAGDGEDTEPQAYKFEKQWLTSVASRVSHPRFTERRAVILVTIDNDTLEEALTSVNKDAGKFSLQQIYVASTGTKNIDTIASVGSANADRYDTSVAIPDTSWEVHFEPGEKLLSDLAVSPIPLWAVLGLITLALFGSVFILFKRFPAALNGEVSKVIEAADRKSALELNIPELVPIAKQLRRATLRALRQSNKQPAAADPAAEPSQKFTSDSSMAGLTNPMFQQDNILDDDDDVLDLDLDLSENTADTRAVADAGFKEHIFRAYDIRGHGDNELTDSMVTKIGKAIGTIAGEMGEQALIVGCDGRKSSPRIKSALIRALMESGRDVIDIGQVPTPLLYFATRHLACKSGVMITGSHNPAPDNGLKIVLNQHTIAAGGIQDIRDRVVEGDFSKGTGRMTREDIVPIYQEEVLQDIAIAVPLKVVIDAGNGVTGDIAPGLFEELGCEVVELFCDIDGNFPNHPPDTSNEDNLADLAAKVQQEEADFGIAFDGDGDRVAIVTATGQIVRSDVLLMLYAQDVVSRNPGADVVFDVKCSRNLTDLVTRHGGRPVLWKTGHAFMKEKMAETGALLGGEFSGHMFFGERWYGFDDGMYAAARLAEILSTHGESLDDSIAKFPASVNTPEILVPVSDTAKFQLIDKIVANADFSAGKVNTMDGIRVDFTHGWGLIRASNTGPALTARFEADSEENLEAIKEEFRAQIALIDPSIELTF
ncbi:MAG: phosphomannomutase/phosphoglucomutase [Halioglobus sp.]